MRTMKKITAIFLAAAMTAGLLTAMPLTASAAPLDLDVGSSSEMKDALDSYYDAGGDLVYDTVNIKITKSFTYDDNIELADPLKLNINLNSCNLTVTTTQQDIPAVSLSSGAAITVTGPGRLTVQGISCGIKAEGAGTEFAISNSAIVWVMNDIQKYTGWAGPDTFTGSVQALDGAAVTVTSVLPPQVQYPYNVSTLYAAGGGIINITGDVNSSIANGNAAEADGGTVNIGGNVTLQTPGSGAALYALNSGEITVKGSVRINSSGGHGGNTGALAQDGSAITVDKNVSVYTTDNGTGIKAENSIAAIKGNVWVSVSNGAGKGICVESSLGSEVYIYGSIGGSGAITDIRLGTDTNISADDPVNKNVELPAPYDGIYWSEFTDETSYVYKRQSGFIEEPAPPPADPPPDPPADPPPQAPQPPSDTITGWSFIGGNWYYFINGTMQTGWIHDGHAWYYLRPGSGIMATGWLYVGNVWYYLRSSGAMAEGWIHDGHAWYYLTPVSGAMATGWIYTGGKWYYLQPSGAMIESDWILWNGLWYYLKSSGAMAEDEWITWNGARYYLGKDGAWMKNASAGLKAQAADVPYGSTSYIEADGTGGPDAPGAPDALDAPGAPGIPDNRDAPDA